ncbi:dTDP-4-dehydrorhamnose reductase [candidate division WOR-3 bacterium]|uniref:dTDP-4-dehydrorhamnose reductase n=1 Tax=candidate division WOR-3 bacterium TaxID=2052148 RepID=A0A9D5QC33_UNCW3|nr:dTDP-4-dehydrorhamnose reductase [candidate division WOR-3 bacterium]MBD3363596.1 dTDP-4-dehydrorhamnose reductase [candidate division WOR-3 bacterium]
MTDVVVTGASGRLGSALYAYLKGLGSKVIGVTRGDFDLASPADVSRFVRDTRPDFLFHPAAMTNVDACEREPEKAYSDNVKATENLARSSIEHGVRFIYFSTDYVFDGEKGEPYIETDTPNPVNVYGRTKLNAEESVTGIVKDYLIIRVSWLFGVPGDFCSFVLSRLNQGLPLKLTTDHRGAPAYIPDLLSVIWEMAKSGEQGIFHLVNSGDCTRFEMGNEILSILGMDAEPEAVCGTDVGFLAKRPPQSVLECSRLKHKFGISLRSWQEALGDYLKDAG